MKRERGGRGGTGWEPLDMAQGTWTQGLPLSPTGWRTPEGGPDPSSSQGRLKAAGQPHSIPCVVSYVHNCQDPSRYLNMAR